MPSVHDDSPGPARAASPRWWGADFPGEVDPVAVLAAGVDHATALWLASPERAAEAAAALSLIDESHRAALLMTAGWDAHAAAVAAMYHDHQQQVVTAHTAGVVQVVPPVTGDIDP